MSFQMNVGRRFLLRAEHESDIIEFLSKFSEKKEVTTAIFTAVGAVKSAKIAFYDQETHQYIETVLSEPQEIASCIGNISLKEGKPFVHIHVVLADRDGNTFGGHLLHGKVFAAEIHLTELIGPELVRRNDVVTRLSLWINV